MTKALKLFAGPCVLESEDLVMFTAERLKKIVDPYGKRIEFFFKGSFDKANRSSPTSYRGPGLEEGLSLLEKVSKRFDLSVITDFHEAAQAEILASVVDVLQIPAFLCRQTDMVVAGAKAASKYGRLLKMKKGQFLSPYEAKNMVDKAQHFLPLDKILLTERGSSFGYNQLMVDMRSFQIMKSFGTQVIFDATHSLQCPGALGTQTGGQREFFGVLAQAAIAAGCDGLFIETHPEPSKALSDATTSWPLDQFEGSLKRFMRLFEVMEEMGHEGIRV